MVPNLHIFTDSSMRAYGVCAYLLTENTPTRLWLKKTRVAPIKHTPLPCLELIGPVVEAKMAKNLNGILNTKSATIMVWQSRCSFLLHSKRSMNQFIFKRKAAIEESTEGYTRKYILPDFNPVDLQRKRFSNKQFKDNTLWMNDPT